jgi:glutathione S-transferase
MRLYELAGRDPELLFSPYCWRTRFALAHKGLSAETAPWRFTEKDRIAFAGASKVPVLEDGERTVHDSWTIALYLDETYPDRPALFPAGAHAHARFIRAWADSALATGLARLIVADIPALLDDPDHGYFVESREQRFGMKLAEVCAGRETDVAAFRATLGPLRTVLKEAPWFGGNEPDYADYILAGSFMWARAVSRFAVLADDDPVAAWFGRVLDLFDGMGRKAKTV